MAACSRYIRAAHEEYLIDAVSACGRAFFNKPLRNKEHTEEKALLLMDKDTEEWKSYIHFFSSFLAVNNTCVVHLEGL